MHKKVYKCPECGPAPTHHYVAWLSTVVDWVFSPYFKLMDRVWHKMRKVVIKLPWDKIAHYSMWMFSKIKLGEVVNDIRPDHSLRTRALWGEAKKRGIQIFEFRPFGKSIELMVAHYGNKKFAFDGLPRPRYKQTGSEWMDDKMIMRDKFLAAGLPVARGGAVILVKKALAIFDQIEGPVIVKPRFGSRSRHTWINVTTRSLLVEAFYSAQKLCPWVVVEEQLIGPVYRATVIGGKLIGVARRDYPQIIGKDKSMFFQDSDIFVSLPKDEEAEVELRRQGLFWQDIPVRGQIIKLGQKVNRGSGGITYEVTSETHPDNVVLFEKIAKVVDDSIIGIDFICLDIAKPWYTQKACGVIECNSLPFIDLHHYPISGEPKNVAGAIWDQIWPQA